MDIVNQTMKMLINGAAWILALFFTAAWINAAHAAQINPYIGPDSYSTDNAVFEIGACKITVLKTYFWRDWMPIVSDPGPDHGSPLHAKVQLNLDNSAGGSNKLSFRAVIIDGKGQSYPAAFHVLPNFRVLPETIDNPESWRSLDDEARKSVIEQYNVYWNGELKPGEVRKVELLAADGPYLPVASGAGVEITLTDQKGGSVVVKTPITLIQRTY